MSRGSGQVVLFRELMGPSALNISEDMREHATKNGKEPNEKTGSRGQTGVAPLPPWTLALHDPLCRSLLRHSSTGTQLVTDVDISWRNEARQPNEHWTLYVEWWCVSTNDVGFVVENSLDQSLRW